MLRIALAAAIITLGLVSAAETKCVRHPSGLERNAGTWPKYRVRNGQRCWYLVHRGGEGRKPVDRVEPPPAPPASPATDVAETPVFSARWERTAALGERGLVYALVKTESEVMPNAPADNLRGDDAHVAQPRPPQKTAADGAGFHPALAIIFWFGAMVALAILAIRFHRKKPPPSVQGRHPELGSDKKTTTSPFFSMPSRPEGTPSRERRRRAHPAQGQASRKR